MKCLVTGGAGFIGSHLTAALVKQGHQVTILDNLSTGKESNIAGIPPKNLTFINGDIADYGTVSQAMAGCEIVFHQAAMVSVPRSLFEPALNNKSNVTGVFNVFEAARQHRVKRVVYASSAAIYGDDPSLPKTENSPVTPLTPYGAAKRIAEIYAEAYANAYEDLQFVGLRYMNVYGPRQDPSSPYSGVLSIFCQAALQGQTCRVFGDGKQTRDFVFVSDVVQANLLAAFGKMPAKSTVFNVGRGEETSLNKILSTLANLTPIPLTIKYEPARTGDIKRSVADISAARTVLGFKPAISLQNGLKITLDWFRGITHIGGE